MCFITYLYFHDTLYKLFIFKLMIGSLFKFGKLLYSSSLPMPLFLLLVFLLRCLSKKSFFFLIIFRFINSLCRFLSLNSSRPLPRNKRLLSFFFLLFPLCDASKVAILPVVSCAGSLTCIARGNSPRSALLLFVVSVRCSRSRIKTSLILV